MKRRPFLALAALLVLIPGPMLAAGAEERPIRVLPLQHRPAEDLLPLLRPLLGPGETLTGEGMRLVARATPATLAQLEQAVAALDRASADLRLSLQWGEADADTGGGHRITTRRDTGIRSLRLLEGETALVRSERNLPRGTARLVPVPGGIAVEPHITRQRLQEGFLVKARLLPGERVRLDIRSLRERPDPAGGGRSLSQAVETAVTADLGEWIPLSTLHRETAAEGSRVLRTREPEHRRELDLRVRVERME
ncbi:secretin N-terminal domain-containing protein [Ectothiorhodospira mobilis]|uniref:secretin N-terminal domain-containing protein n=1 Tax=Ectothiorhodospira mobilis TaxID=195064 RepID=UPI00190355D8|nr:secretin N-terminal domain-containing protein [Ectothiorhodospira mobilis]MBK1691446.1 hypothetical protein [Ectothiorhodospira mobilis]